ncbi:MAG: metallophosphoesterase family protein [Nitrospirae bacterium]|nr:metallophosphoesterase family protein [Nitrospirota bacterium]
MKKLVGAATLTILFIGSTAAQAAITKGPYLTNLSPYSVTVNWESDAPTKGIVNYGTNVVFLDKQADESASATNHHVTVTGLDPSTFYYYKVISGSVESGGSSSYFTTSILSCQPFRFAVYGDTRGATQWDDPFTQHAKIIKMIDEKIGPDFIIGTGDYVYVGGDNTQWQYWFDTTKNYLNHNVLFPAIGNHDANDSNGTNWKRFWLLPQGPDTAYNTYYAFTYGNTRFVVYDDYKDATPGSAQYKWIESELTAAKADSNIQHVFLANHETFEGVTWHGPNDNNQNNIEPLAEKYGIDATLSGHEHSYQRAYKNGVYHLLTGGGGAPLDGLVNLGFNCKLQVRQNSSLQTMNSCTHHAMQFDVNGSHIDIKTLSIDGSTVLDSFTIDKGADKNPACVPPGGGGGGGGGEGGGGGGGGGCTAVPFGSSAAADLGLAFAALALIGLRRARR